MRYKWKTLWFYTLLSLIGLTTVYPLLWMVSTSLQSSSANISDLTGLFGGELEFGNYRRVLAGNGFFRAFLNSVFVTLTLTVGQCFTSSLAAYAFARMKFFARDQLFLGYLGTLMIPGAVTMIPAFLILREFGWIDSYAALIVPGMFSAYGTFMLRQFFLALPHDLEEAARIDGCGAWGVYWHVVLPLSQNALLTLAILTFMGTWNALMWPVIVVHSQELYTLPLALAKFNDMFGIHWPLLMAGSVVMILPMLLLFVAGQKYFVKGIMLGAVKG